MDAGTWKSYTYPLVLSFFGLLDAVSVDSSQAVFLAIEAVKVVVGHRLGVVPRIGEFCTAPVWLCAASVWPIGGIWRFMDGMRPRGRYGKSEGRIGGSWLL